MPVEDRASGVKGQHLDRLHVGSLGGELGALGSLLNCGDDGLRLRLGESGFAWSFCDFERI